MITIDAYVVASGNTWVAPKSITWRSTPRAASTPRSRAAHCAVSQRDGTTRPIRPPGRTQPSAASRNAPYRSHSPWAVAANAPRTRRHSAGSASRSRIERT